MRAILNHTAAAICLFTLTALAPFSSIPGSPILKTGFSAVQPAIPGLFPSLAHAAPGPGELRDLARQQEQIIQQQEERRRMQEKEFLRGQPGAPSEQPVQPLPHVPDQPGAPCLEVKNVEIAGATLISANTLKKAVRPYEGKCLSLPDINNLLRDISNIYIDKGYVTARAFVDPQAGNAGILRVMVVEGVIEQIIINDGDRDYIYRGKTAFPGLVGKPLNLRDIEQGIDQLNRLPSGNATMELAPGKGLGGTIVKVTIPNARSWRLGAGFDNLGQRSTGEFQYNLSLEKDNLMGIGDQFAVYWSEDAPMFEGLATHPSTGHNTSFSAFASLPWGYWTFSGSLSRSTYSTKVFGETGVYNSEGETTVHSLSVDRVIHRDADSKTSLSLALANRDVKSFFQSVKLGVSSYIITTLEAALSHNHRMLGGVAGLRLAYTRGHPLFGSKEQEAWGHSIPRSEFDKYTASLTFYRPFAVLDQQLYWSLSAQGQMAPQTLYGAERIQIGSRSTVRGFQESSISGDQGAYSRNEIGWNLPWFESLKKEGTVSGVQLYALYDYGFIQRDSHDPFEQGRMQGAGIGLRTLGDFSLDVTMAKPLEHPSFVDSKDIEFYASVKYTF